VHGAQKEEGRKKESDSSKADRPLPLRLATFCNKLVKNFWVPLQFYVFSTAREMQIDVPISFHVYPGRWLPR